MLADTIKKQMIEAMKSKDVVAKEILRLALGEIQSDSARTGKAPEDERSAAIVRKLVKSNQETQGLAPDDATKEKLAREIEVLEALLPKSLSVEEIVEALAPVLEEIRAAGNDGQATGVAMRHLKPSGAPVQGKDVSAAVKQIRAG